MQHFFAIHNKPIFAVCRLIFTLSSADAETVQHVSHWTHLIGCKQWRRQDVETREGFKPLPFPSHPKGRGDVESRFLALCDRRERERPC